MLDHYLPRYLFYATVPLKHIFKFLASYMEDTNINFISKKKNHEQTREIFVRKQKFQVYLDN
jgi:hypothetical protein